MNQIKFFKHCTKIGVYYNRGKLDGILDKLALFLSIEVTSFESHSWIDFLETADEGDETSGNMMTLEKRNGNAYIGNVYHNRPESERKYFVIAIPELIDLMKTWDKLMEEKPEEIILSSDNGKFELIGNNISTVTIDEDIEC